MDLYGILGVSVDATPDQVRTAYRAKVTQIHPDKSKDAEPDAAVKLQAVMDAYRTLRDPQLKAEYDTQRTIKIQQLNDIYSWIPRKGEAALRSEMPLNKWSVPSRGPPETFRVNMADIETL